MSTVLMTNFSNIVRKGEKKISKKNYFLVFTCISLVTMKLISLAL